MKKYLIRLDDACPTMDKTKWQGVEDILDRYGIKPMVGVIPNNENPHEMIHEPDVHFWEKVRSWQEKGWAIAMHGYNHCYTSESGLNGLNPMWKRSEFAGLPLEQQREKIRLGVSIMRANGVNPQYFFAPSHTFDNNTLIALYEESDIRVISDTIARQPYKYKEFLIIPQIGGHCTKIRIPGIWTFCLHPNTMSESGFNQLDAFLSKEFRNFISFNDLKDSTFQRGKDWFSCMMSLTYFILRKLRRVK